MNSRDQWKLKKFIKDNKDPILTELTSKTLKTIQDSKQLVILPIMAPGQLEQYLIEIHKYEELKSSYEYKTLVNKKKF